MPDAPESPKHIRSIDLGLVLLLIVLLLIPFLIWYLVASWPATDNPPSDQETPAIEAKDIRSGREEARRIARLAGERNTRNHLRRLVDALARAKLDLENAVTQARLDPQPAARKRWQEFIDDRRSRVLAASERLSTFETLLGK